MDHQHESTAVTPASTDTGYWILDPEPAEPQGASERFTVRAATLRDLAAMVEVDLQAFDGVYTDYGDREALRERLQTSFRRRFDLVGGEWMPVLEAERGIVGFMTCCPTSKRPEDFASWEDTTDNGTLRTTYDASGKNVYVVTLSVLREGSPGKDMLFAHQIGKMLAEGYELAFFESRLPGFRTWLTDVEDIPEPEGMEEGRLFQLAQQYFDTHEVVKGARTRLDRLIRLYERVGCKALAVVPDAYRDEPSLNFGVVCVYDGSSLFDGSSFPLRLPHNRLTRKVAGRLLQKIAMSQPLTARVFS